MQKDMEEADQNRLRAEEEAAQREADGKVAAQRAAPALVLQQMYRRRRPVGSLLVALRQLIFRSLGGEQMRPKS